MRPPSFSPSGSHRAFPASIKQAVDLYPEVIFSLAQDRLRVTPVRSDGSESFLLEDDSKALKLLVPLVDFEIIKKISASFGPRLSPFPSEPLESIRDRARALIRVEFAGRGAF